MKRTYPQPSPWHEILIGDRIRFQSEAMPVEIEDTVVAREHGMIITEGGREILPAYYILRVDPPDLHEPLAAGPADVDDLCRELQTIGHTTAADLLLRAHHVAGCLTERIDGLVGDLRHAREWLAPAID